MIKQPAYKYNYLATGLFLLAGLIFVLFTIHAPIGDFGNYYYGSKLVADGKFSLADYQNIHHFNRQIASYGESAYFENYTPVPPFSLLFYLPLTVLSAAKAKLVFNLASLLIFCLSFFRFLRHLKAETAYVYLVPVIFLYPLYHNIYQGQAYLLIVGFLMEAFLADETKKPFLSALFLALSISLKLFPVFILLYYLIKKRFKPAIYTVPLVTAFQLITVCVAGLPVLSHYFVQVLPRLMDNDIIGRYYFSNQSLYTLLLNLFSYEGLQNTHPLINMPWIIPLIESLFVSIILYTLYSLRYKENTMFFGMALFFCVLSGRYNTTYGMLVLIPFGISIITGSSFLPKRFLFLFILMAALSMPIGKFVNSVMLIQYSRLMGLLAVFVLVLIEYKPKIQLSIFAIILCSVTAFNYCGFTYNNPAYFEVQNTKGILYDYRIQNDSITLFSTLGSKDYRETVPLKGNAKEEQELSIQARSLYYGDIQIYSSEDNKQKPFVYNDTLAVFMSDMNQGLGFYKLRVVPLEGTKKKL